MRVAVDAFNLLADRRGMGRFARSVLASLALEPDFSITLVARTPRDVRALQAEFPFDAVTPREAGRAGFDAAWYPWNGMRFRVARWSVVTMHDAFAFTCPARDFVGRWKEQAPIRRAAREAHALTTVSQWSARELGENLGIPKKRFAITPPVPDPFFTPVEAAPPAKPFFFAVGGPDERKNIPLLIEAWLRAFPDRAIGLHIAGTLSDNDERLAAKAGIARSKPDDATLRQLYVQALAVAVPSTSEGYGLMSVEAMACGAPVLAADAAGLPEACDGAALLLSPTNVERWTQALRDIATGEFQRRALHERSLQRVARIDRTATPRIIAAFLRRSREGAR